MIAIINPTHEDARRTKAGDLLRECITNAMLRVPAHMPNRELVIADAALMSALDALLDAAQGTKARVLSVVAANAILRGREGGLPYSEIIGAFHMALSEAAMASMEADERGN